MRWPRVSYEGFPPFFHGFGLPLCLQLFHKDVGAKSLPAPAGHNWVLSPATRPSRAAQRAGGLALDDRGSGGHGFAGTAGADPCLATGGGRYGGHHSLWRLDRGQRRLPRPGGPPTGIRWRGAGRPRRRGATSHHSASTPVKELVASVRGARCREPEIGTLAALTAASSTRLWPGTCPGRDPFAGGHNGKGGDSHARVRQSL